MKKLIIAALGIVVLFGLAFAQPALAAKPVKLAQIVYLVTLEGGNLLTIPDCGTPGVGSNLGTLTFNFADGCFKSPTTFVVLRNGNPVGSVTLESGAFGISVKSGEVVAISAPFFVASDGTHWSASEVPASSMDYDGKKDTNCFTVTVTGDELTLTKSVRGKDKKDPAETIIVGLGNIVFRTHLEDGTHPDSPDCPLHPVT